MLWHKLKPPRIFLLLVTTKNTYKSTSKSSIIRIVLSYIEKIKMSQSGSSRTREIQKTKNRIRLASLFSIYIVYKLIESYMAGDEARTIIYALLFSMYIVMLSYVYYVRYYKIRQALEN